MSKKLKAYLAGPIRGVADYNERFKKAKRFYKDCGYAVLDPSTLPEGMEQADYMRICFAMIQSANIVQMLPGWEESEGATYPHRGCNQSAVPGKMLSRSALPRRLLR